jgi:hypothetical protein
LPSLALTLHDYRADIEAAEGLWLEMCQQLIEPDQTALNSLLRCYVRGQQASAGCVVYDADAVRDLALGHCRKYNIRPNLTSVNFVLSFYVHEIAG